jgi:hypothetical protein
MLASSPKRLFNLAIEKLKRRVGADDSSDLVRGLDRLASDDRMRAIWEGLGTMAAAASFLEGLVDTITATANVDEIRAEYDRALSELRELERAVDVISGYCARARDEGRTRSAPIGPRSTLPPELGGLELLLEKLVGFATSSASLDRALLTGYLPTSRKSRPDFLVRVHFARLMVREMVVRFGEPHYQAVADAMNVFFDFAEDREVTADGVRDAWRRHEVGVSIRKMLVK